MGETRKIAAILVSDVVGYSRLAGADEDRALSRLRGLRSGLFDSAIAAHHGRIVKRAPARGTAMVATSVIGTSTLSRLAGLLLVLLSLAAQACAAEYYGYDQGGS